MTYNDGYGREFPTQRLARISELADLYPPTARVDQDELILLDDDMQKIARLYQIPIRYLFNGPFEASSICLMARLAGQI
jgi:hypothetical protein